MPYSTNYTDAFDGSLRARMTIALLKAATQIQGESQAGFSSPFAKWSKRQALALAVLTNHNAYVERVTLVCCAAGLATIASTDGQLDTAVASVWDDLAGVVITDT